MKKYITIKEEMTFNDWLNKIFNFEFEGSWIYKTDEHEMILSWEEKKYIVELYFINNDSKRLKFKFLTTDINEIDWFIESNLKYFMED